VKKQRKQTGRSRNYWAEVKNRLPGSAEVEQNLRTLSVNKAMEEQLERYYREKFSLLLAVFGAGVVLSLVLWFVSGQKTELLDGFFLPRKETAYQKKLELQVEEETTEIIVEVEPQQRSKEESAALLETLKGEMEGRILGENLTLEKVRSPLCLMSEIEELGVTVSWELDSYEVLNPDGSIRTENVKPEGHIVELTALLSCSGETAVYQAYAKVLPPLLSEWEQLEQELLERMAQLQEQGKEKEKKELPREVQGKSIVWKEKASSKAGVVFLLTMASMPLLYVARDRELKQQLREREQQMRRDYAQMVSKLVLLMGAGTSVRNAWERLVCDYREKREKGQISQRYVYEEMAVTLREIQNGMAEVQAYENFGRRCGIACCLKLAVLLEQNVKKGSRGLTELLKAEVQEAFEQRKEQARICGEEAATKLLFPMMLMLSVVIILIVVPAWLSMQL